MKLAYVMPAIVLAACSSVFADYPFQIQGIPYPSDLAGIGYPAINQSGQVAVSYFNSSIDPGTQNPSSLAYLWSDGNLTALPLAAGYTTGGVLGINSSGIVVGYVTDVSGGNHPAAWTGGLLTVLDQGSFPQGTAFSVNNNGQIVGQINTAPAEGLSDAAVWNGSTLIDLGNYGAEQAFAVATNNQGDVLIHTFGSATGNNVYLHTGEVDTHITVLGKNAVGSEGINDLGQVLVSDDNNANYIWQDGNATLLDELPNVVAGFPWAIDDNGDVVGFTLDDDYQGRATLWHDDISYDLNGLIDPNSGWNLYIATGITDDGTIVGTGTFDGQGEAFVLTPTGDGQFAASGAPEPASLALLALGSAVLLRRRRR